jgi:hypothetical protein
MKVLQIEDQDGTVVEVCQEHLLIYGHLQLFHVASLSVFIAEAESVRFWALKFECGMFCVFCYVDVIGFVAVAHNHDFFTYVS